MVEQCNRYHSDNKNYEPQIDKYKQILYNKYEYNCGYSLREIEFKFPYNLTDILPRYHFL